ncbi:MAG TPA: hypothetical protein VNT92_01465, partial [Acidimicrobiia bacterium]|nr:hypothetical protein [Acidimicrobiia bacterium]
RAASSGSASRNWACTAASITWAVCVNCIAGSYVGWVQRAALTMVRVGGSTGSRLFFLRTRLIRCPSLRSKSSGV